MQESHFSQLQNGKHLVEQPTLKWSGNIFTELHNHSSPLRTSMCNTPPPPPQPNRHPHDPESLWVTSTHAASPGAHRRLLWQHRHHWSIYFGSGPWSSATSLSARARWSGVAPHGPLDPKCQRRRGCGRSRGEAQSSSDHPSLWDSRAWHLTLQWSVNDAIYHCSPILPLCTSKSSNKPKSWSTWASLTCL